MQEKNDGLVQKLQDKYNIVIDTIKDNIEEIIGLVGVVGILFSLASVPVSAVIHNVEQEKYLSSTVTYNNKEYQMGNIYIVYDVDNVYFCTRDLQKITEAKVIGETGGDVGEYYHRDEIYDYFDIRTGDKICSDHEDGFYIEGLLDLYNESDMNERNYQINLDEVYDNVNADSLLSRDPGVRKR